MLPLFLLFFAIVRVENATPPIVLTTWSFKEAAEKAWQYVKQNKSAVESLEAGCMTCENLQCDHTVGFGGSPDENGETTLDAMIFDGATMNMGAVGGIRNIKHPISVAKYVLQNTYHSFLVGSLATQFAVDMGFQHTSLSTNYSEQLWIDWKNQQCQPNYWTNVDPNPRVSCGPYHLLSENSVLYNWHQDDEIVDPNNHDTIGMIVFDFEGNIAAGTSTNGLNHKIPGRVGDSPIPGAGAYADNEVGAAVATGDGDVMMRFLPSFLAVEEMRRGSHPSEAARTAIGRITRKYPNFMGALIAVNVEGEYGAACNGIEKFPFELGTDEDGVVSKFVECE